MIAFSNPILQSPSPDCARRSLSTLVTPWVLAALLPYAVLLFAACGDAAEPTPAPPSSTAAQPPPTAAPTVAPTVEALPTSVAQPSPAPKPTATQAPAPTAQPTPASEGSVLDRLKQNAADFQYTIGKHGGTLTTATIAEPLTFNLAIANDAYSAGVLSYVFEGLTETSWLTDEVEPRLAESWDSSDDGLTWTFRLRRDVRWHDGEPFTAHDVAFTFNRVIYNHDIPAAARASFHFRFLNEETGEWEEAPMTVMALDNYTVQCVLPQPFAPFLRSMGTAIFPKHILEQYVDDGTFSEVWDIETDPAEVISTGPYTIENYVPGETVILRRNPDYWLEDGEGNKLPYIEKLVDIMAPDFDAELAAFIAGETDVHGVLGEELARLEPMQRDGNFTIHKRGPQFGFTLIGFNQNERVDEETGDPYLDPVKLGWFQQKEFRQAVAYAVDKGRIIDEVQHGVGYPQWSPVSPSAGDFHNPDVRRYEYDLDSARELLDGIGWVDTDGDGVREDRDGNPIEFTMVTNTGNSVRERVGEIVSEGMRDVGLGVDYRLIEFGDLVNRIVQTFDWEAMIVGFTGGADPHEGITFWHSGEPLHVWNPSQEEPATDWEAEIDELYLKASAELDRARRVEYYHRAQEIAAENVPVIYTTLAERLTAVRNVFGNTTPTLYAIWDARDVYRTDQ